MTIPADDPPPEQCWPPISEWVPVRTPALIAMLERGRRIEQTRLRRLP